MKKRLPPPNSRRFSNAETALISFALGIIVTFFFSVRVLIITEALLIIAAVLLCVCDG